MKKLSGYAFYKEVLKSPVHVVAPMVDMSELAWRQLSREYGAHLCYTPMFHSLNFSNSANYRKENFQVHPEDRPLIVQFCGHDPDTVLKAARYVEGQCDAVDLNLGCPQGIAKRGHYGAFLQDEWDLVGSIVSLLHKELAVPVTCKIRIFSDVARTVAYARMLEAAGCQLLTVHGRTREMKGRDTGVADWDQIRAVRQAIAIPMLANGNILYFEDIQRCITHTGVDGVMTAETSLYNPAIFTGKEYKVWEVVDRYLEIAKHLNTGFIYVKGHVFKIYNLTFQIKLHLRDLLSNVHTIQDIHNAQQIIKAELIQESEVDAPDVQVQTVATCHNFKQLPYWICQPYFRCNRLEAKDENKKSIESELYETRRIERKLRKEAKRERKAHLGAQPNKKTKYPDCRGCNRNPASANCVHKMCKPCCFPRSIEHVVDCKQHNVNAKTRHFRRQNELAERENNENTEVKVS